MTDTEINADPVRDVLAASGFADRERKITSEQLSPISHGMRNRSAEPRETVPNSLRRK